MAGILSIEYLVPSLFSSFVLFLLREYFAYRKVLSLKYILTPLVTLSILLVILVSINHRGVSSYRILVLVAILMSLVADTLLMIEEVSLLKPGIVFFMLAHIFYTTAFSGGYSFEFWNIPVALLLVFFIKKSSDMFLENAGDLKIPVFAYILVISIMGFFAVTGLNRGFSLKSLTASAGAVLFIISDLVLAYNQFVKEIPHSSVKTWALYAPAQMLIVLSCL
jgi:alkenylglycerophosphocholine hydrolase